MVTHGVRMLAERSAASRSVPDRVCWCRISYRQHFRPPAALREIRHADGTRTHELTVDLGQVVSPQDLQRCFAEALDGPQRAPGVDIGRFGPVGASPIWEFNAAFWNHMPGYMAAVGRGVRESIGGSPDDGQARTREHARRFGTLLAAAAAAAAGADTASGARPARPLAYLDVGAADTGYAETLIRHLAATCHTPMHYVVADRAAGALRRARARLGPGRGPVSVRYLALDLAQPARALEEYRGRLLTVHLTNLLDNLPGEELVQVDGRHYLLHTCLYLPAAALEQLARQHRLDPGQLAADLSNLADTGVDPFLAHYRDRLPGRAGGGAGAAPFLAH